jgi:hypothetical protein
MKNKKNPIKSRKIFNILNTKPKSILKESSGKLVKKLKNRKTNSLKVLTKKFIKIVKEQNNNIINLKDIISQIKSKRRRIYDVTNVFEGIS